jgi:glutamyl-tRNA synthetase
MISRLAPTPSGTLHLGNLYNFALTWAWVRREQGRLALRIDDLDGTRVRPEFVESIFEDLKWLGFNWDLGPQSSREFFQTHSQSLKKADYFQALCRLSTYTCDCSRSQIQARSLKTNGAESYDGYCRERGLSFQPGHTLLRGKIEGLSSDPILWTRDDRPAYHWVSVLDDLKLGTTHIVRGEDLRESSEIQKQIARALGESRYGLIQYRFHPLLLAPDGKKLSKSKGSASIVLLRQGGAKPGDVWRELSMLLPKVEGESPPHFSQLSDWLSCS